MHISLALATYNEEENITACIESCTGLVDEIMVVDGSSTDKTPELALKAGATVIRTQNERMFHINKQKAIDACTGEWILQLDADERVTVELAEEIKSILQMTNNQINQYQGNLKERKLFERHKELVQGRFPDSAGGFPPTGAASRSESPPALGSPSSSATCSASSSDSLYNAFFIPRLNYFLGGYLRSGGVYPDGVIRLIRKGKAHLPCKDIHELMAVEGKTGWLANPLIHKDSPTFKRYLERNSRYIDHLVEDLRVESRKSKAESIVQKMRQFLDWVIMKPIITFFSLVIRHKGIRDGWRGVVFAFFSAIRFARAYLRYTMEG